MVLGSDSRIKNLPHGSGKRRKKDLSKSGGLLVCMDMFERIAKCRR